MFRTNALQRGIGQDTVNGRQYRTTTDSRGRTIIGPVRHRKHKDMQQKKLLGDSNELTAIISNGLRISLPPVPPRRKKPLRTRVADRFRAGWYRITDPDVHKLGMYIAGNLLLWTVLVGTVGLVTRALLWAWS
jgi:hypothetical protein